MINAAEHIPGENSHELVYALHLLKQFIKVYYLVFIISSVILSVINSMGLADSCYFYSSIILFNNAFKHNVRD